ncbi:hypothetical protein QO017_003355 [Methylobacterium gregans]|nr:hypothetical protein [Methylobacterium gregans]
MVNQFLGSNTALRASTATKISSAAESVTRRYLSF